MSSSRGESLCSPGCSPGLRRALRRLPDEWDFLESRSLSCASSTDARCERRPSAVELMVLGALVCASSVALCLAGEGRALEVLVCASSGSFVLCSTVASRAVCSGGALFLFLVFALVVKAMAFLFRVGLQQWRELKKKIQSLQQAKKNARESSR